LVIVNSAAMNISVQVGVSIVSWLMFLWVDAQKWYLYSGELGERGEGKKDDRASVIL
jgi:hypothetical protein